MKSFIARALPKYPTRYHRADRRLKMRAMEHTPKRLPPHFTPLTVPRSVHQTAIT